MDHVQWIEAALEEMSEHPARVLHEVHIFYALRHWAGLEEMSAEQRHGVLGEVALACHSILCPPTAIGMVASDVYLLAQLIPERCVDDVPQAVKEALSRRTTDLPRQQWDGLCSATGVSIEDVDELAAAISAGDPLIRNWFRNEEG